MKKRFACLLAMLMLAGCAAQEPETVETEPVATPIPVVTEIPETEAQQNSEIFSQEMAMIEGYVVMQDGDVWYNQRNWFDFVKSCENGEPASVKVAHYAFTDTGMSSMVYNLAYDGKLYTVSYTLDGELQTEQFSHLVFSWKNFDDTMAPYDVCQRYTLSNTEEQAPGLVIYEDLIANPDFDGVTEIRLHAKESQPPVKTYSGPEAEAILSVLGSASYLACPPEQYAYCMKLIMVNGAGNEIVMELEMNSGICRYGMQTYEYGTLREMFDLLGMEDWPESVKQEFGAYIG